MGIIIGHYTDNYKIVPHERTNSATEDNISKIISKFSDLADNRFDKIHIDSSPEKMICISVTVIVQLQDIILEMAELRMF